LNLQAEIKEYINEEIMKKIQHLEEENERLLRENNEMEDEVEELEEREMTANVKVIKLFAQHFGKELLERLERKVGLVSDFIDEDQKREHLRKLVNLM
jgi:cell division septum initiation protein DivIVA